MNQLEIRFDGATIEPQRDNLRLNKQLQRVYDCMKDGQWRSLESISDLTGDPCPSISSRLRDLRKRKFGGFKVERQYITHGLFYYRLVLKTSC